MTQPLYNVPNMISYVRILLIPALAILMGLMNPELGKDANGAYAAWATIIFSLAGVSDLVDGYYARKYKAVSTMGKFIDPMADKLIHMTAMIMLIPLGRLPAWVVVILLFREIFITGVRAVAAGEGLIIPAADAGKMKTVWLNFGLGGMIYFYPLFAGTRWEINVYGTAVLCMALGFLFSVISAIMYTVQFIKVINKR